MAKKHLMILAVIISQCLGCSIIKTIPEKAVPTAIHPEIYGAFSPATGWLDCLSGQLSREQNFSKKITVASVTNKLINDPEGICLPSMLKPFVENSFARINAGYELYDSENLTGIQGLTQALPNIGFTQENILHDVVLGDIVRPDFVIVPFIYGCTNVKAAIAEVDYILGLNAEVKAYNIAASVQVVDANTRRTVLTTSLTVRLYTTATGASIFHLTGNNLINGQYAFSLAANTTAAIQYLSDFLVAATVRDLSSALLNKTFAMCDPEIPGRDNSKIPIQAKTKSGELPLNLMLTNEDVQICLGVKSANCVIKKNDFYKISIRQFSSVLCPNIPIDPVLQDVIKGSLLMGGGQLCITKDILEKNCKILEVEVRNYEDDEILGIVAGDI